MLSRTTTDIGKGAENFVAKYFVESGYKILAQNWKTKWCEIDIIAKKNNGIYFIEVKHRKNINYGDGLEAITAKKLKQMNFAAEMWIAENNLDCNYSLVAVSTIGNPPKISAIVDL